MWDLFEVDLVRGDISVRGVAVYKQGIPHSQLQMI